MRRVPDGSGIEYPAEHISAAEAAGLALCYLAGAHRYATRPESEIEREVAPDLPPGAEETPE